MCRQNLDNSEGSLEFVYKGAQWIECLQYGFLFWDSDQSLSSAAIEQVL